MAPLREADRLVGGDAAFLIIDDTVPPKGKQSVSVAPQYAASMGKNANCQTLVSTTLAQEKVPVMIRLKLFLSESWGSNPARLDRARVPATESGARIKPQIA